MFNFLCPDSLFVNEGYFCSHQSTGFRPIGKDSLPTTKAHNTASRKGPPQPQGEIRQHTRIIIINGHREIGLVLAGRYVLRKSLVVAIKSKLPYKLSLHKSKTVVDFHFKWPFDCSKKSTLAIKMIQKV